jgi:alpha-1,6-mannosyltransferase
MALRLLDVVQFYSPLSGGVKRYLHDKMEFLASRPQVEHAALVPSYADRLRRVGASRLYEAASPRIPGSSYRVLWAPGRIRRAALAERPQVVEVGSPYQAAWHAMAAARRVGARVVGFYHSDYPRALGDRLGAVLGRRAGEALTGLLERYLAALYGRMDAVACASSRYRDLLSGLGLDQVVLTPLGADTATFRPRPSRRRLRARLGLEPGQWLLLFVGRLAAMKHPGGLAGMMERLPAGHYHLVVIGDGERRWQVEAAARRRPDVTWLGYMADREELARWYSAADLFVTPGTHETFGLTALEAQACGTRVLAVAGGGVEAALAGEEPLILAQSPAPGDLARAVERIRGLGEGPGARQARRERLVRLYGLEASFGRLLRLYEHLAAGGRAREFD